MIISILDESTMTFSPGSIEMNQDNFNKVINHLNLVVNTLNNLTIEHETLLGEHEKLATEFMRDGMHKKGKPSKNLVEKEETV
jgi:hypothetical protein